MRLTKEQAIILTAVTGKLVVDFASYQDAVEAKLGRPVMTHEFADKETAAEIRDMFFPDFLDILPEGLHERR